MPTKQGLSVEEDAERELARKVLHETASKNNDGFMSGQVRWILDAMQEFFRQNHERLMELSRGDDDY